MTLRLIPPTGHQIKWKDLRKIADFSIENGFWLNSGTSALTFLLESLKIAPQSGIVIPAYTCPAVAAAVLKAGHRPVLSDINPDTLNYDLDQLVSVLKNQKPAAAIWVNLFGLPSSIPDLKIPVIVDNAQLPFTPLKPENAAAEMYSFGRGKPINALGGGVAIIHQFEHFKDLNKRYQNIPRSLFVNSLFYLTKIIAFKLFYHPTRYPIPFHISFLRLGETNFAPHFKLQKISGINLRCVENIFSRFAGIQKIRSDVCLKYCNILKRYKEKIGYFNMNAFSKFPIIFKTESDRIPISESLLDSGILANTLYPFALNVQPGLREILNDSFFYKGAEFLSKNLITLPVNEFIDDAVIDKVDKTFEKFYS